MAFILFPIYHDSTIFPRSKLKYISSENAANQFCCTKHKNEVLEKRVAYVNSRNESNKSELTMAVKHADR
jgi:hypothetical protein